MARPGYRFAHPGYASCSGRAGPNVPCNRRPVLALRLGQIVHCLTSREFGAGAEETREPKGGVRRHRPLAFDDGADAGRRNTQRERERIGGETKRLEKFLAPGQRRAWLPP